MTDSYTLLVNSISSPIQLGIYRSSELTKSIELEGKTSDVLVEMVYDILGRYNIGKIIYVNGPGSYMAIKLTYIMLETIKMIKNIDFYAVSGFELNDAKPIKAMGKLYFIKEKETIITQKFDEDIKQEFWLPKSLSALTLRDDNLPEYTLPAV